MKVLLLTSKRLTYCLYRYDQFQKRVKHASKGMPNMEKHFAYTQRHHENGDFIRQPRPNVDFREPDGIDIPLSQPVEPNTASDSPMPPPLHFGGNSLPRPNTS